MYRKYHFDLMEIGDSTWVEGSRAESAKVCAIMYGKKAGKRFAVRNEGDGRRIWRVA